MKRGYDANQVKPIASWNKSGLLCYPVIIPQPLSERSIMSKITEQDVAYVASLAQLRLDADATTRLVREMSDILAYMDTLNALDTDNIEPMMHALEMTNVFREDVTAPSLSREAALQNAPLDDGAYFVVPKILEGEDGS